MSLAAKNDCFTVSLTFSCSRMIQIDHRFVRWWTKTQLNLFCAHMNAIIQHPCADLADPGEPVVIRGHCDDIASGELWLNGLGSFPKPNEIIFHVYNYEIVSTNHVSGTLVNEGAPNIVIYL